MRRDDEALSTIERALATAAGGEADAMLVSVDRNISRFANSSLHQNMSEREDVLVIRIFDDARVGVASTTTIEDDEIRRVAELARDIARRSEPLRGFKGLYAGGGPCPEVFTFDGKTAALTPSEKATDLRQVFDRGAAKNVRYAGAYNTTIGSIAVGNTRGVRRYAQFTSADASFIALTGSTSGFATRASRRAREVNVIALGDEATSKALLAAGTDREIEPGEYTVILEPPAIGEIFEWMDMITFSGQSYEDGSSFLVDQLGKRVTGDAFSLADDAIDEEFLAFPFDMEGRPKRRVPIIHRGLAVTPLVDTLMSDRLGVSPTASAGALGSSDHGMGLHLSMAGGDATTEELIASTERGIWVTRFHYLNGFLEPKRALMTGMTRDGTFLIENGRVAGRLPNLRWTQSMVDAFANIEGLTRERRAIGIFWNLTGAFVTPTAKIAKWTINGSSGK